MKPSPLVVVLGLVLGFVSGAEATSVATPLTKALTDEPYCEVEAKYLGEHAPTEFVYWRFSPTGPARAVGEIVCAPLSGEFHLRIFGAKKSQALGKIVYPEYVPTVHLEKKYKIQVIRRTITHRARRESRTEWTVKNWREGFQKAEN